MSVPKPVRAWVADAEATYGPTFAAWFLPDFDWQAFCADAPALAARLGEAWASPTAAAGKARLEETAADVFRGAHIAALALLAAYDATSAPDDALERLCAPPEGDEREALADVAADLEAVERALVLDDGAEADDVPGESLPGEGRVDRAATAARAVREAVRALVADGVASASAAIVRLGVSPRALSQVLAGVLHVAVALAGLRHAAAAEADAAAGREALSLDVRALRSALAPTA